MSDDDFVNVEWNEFVTYTARIPRKDMEKAIAVHRDPCSNESSIGIILQHMTDSEIIDSKGMESITFHDDGNQIGEL